MKLNRTDAFWDRSTRNSINENWDILEGSARKMESDFNNFKDSVTEDVVDQLVDNARLDWKEPVESYADLPADDPVGTVRQVLEPTAEGVNKMYRKYEDGWKVIQEYDATAINEVDSRLTAQLAESEQEITNLNKVYPVSPSVVSAFWDSPAVPSARPGESGAFANVTWKYDEMINNLWEPLRQQEPDYIKRINKGKDASGVYDWWRYEFTPPSYEKTMIIGAGIHGPERIGIYTLFRFMYHVVNDWKIYPQLSYLRHKVRLIIIPCQNPWGLSNLKRQNYNGVDLNRNFDYKWASAPVKQPWDHDYKGTAPFSEIEAVYIRDTLEAFSDATTYLDLHNYGSVAEDFIVFTPRRLSVDSNPYRSVIDYLSKPESTINWSVTNYPSAFNYATDRFGMHSSNPEFSEGKYGPSHGAEDMTAALKWFGNVILAHAKLEGKAVVSTAVNPFVKHMIYNSSPPFISIPVRTQYAELSDLQLSFSVPSKGVVIFEGEITVLASETAKITYITPKLGQEGTDFSPETVQNSLWEVYSDVKGRVTIPFSAAIPVLPTSVYAGNVVVGLYAFTEDHTVTLYRYRARATYIPSDASDGYETYTATNRAGTGVGAMRKIYPS